MLLFARFFLPVLAFVLVLCGVASAPLAQSKQPVGTIVRTEGDVRFTGENGSVTAHEQDPVYPYSTIKTGPDARALILFIDDTEMTLGEKTELTIDKYVFDPGDATENQGRFSILRGAFLYVSGMLSHRKDPDVKIKTAYGSIGIRGTAVWGGPIRDDYGIFVQEGEILFSGENGSVSLPQGTGTIITKGKAPAPANAWASEKIQNLREKVAFSVPPDEIDQAIEDEMLRNIERRQEYRKIVWPYKTQGWSPAPDSGDPTMSKDFRQMGEKHRKRLRLHDERLRNDPNLH